VATFPKQLTQRFPAEFQDMGARLAQLETRTAGIDSGAPLAVLPATIDPAYTSGNPSCFINGAATLTGPYQYLASYSPVAGDAVLVMPTPVTQSAVTSYVVLCSLGSGWNYVGTAGNPAFAANWANAGSGNASLAFMLTGVSVQVTGAVIPSAGAGATLFTLPAGYLPASHQTIFGLNRTTGASVGWLIRSTGAVQFFGATGIIAGDTFDINGSVSLNI
jgi:hypothetical protein